MELPFDATPFNAHHTNLDGHLHEVVSSPPNPSLDHFLPGLIPISPQQSQDTPLSLPRSDLAVAGPTINATINVEADIQAFSGYFLQPDQQHLRHLLDTILMSDWLLSNDFDLEGRCRSLLVQFLDNQRGTLRCLFDGCKKKFSRQDRAITHIRVHLAHRPFVCGGQCGNNYW